MDSGFRREFPSRNTSRSPNLSQGAYLGADQPQRSPYTPVVSLSYQDLTEPPLAPSNKEPSRSELAAEKRRLEFVKLLQVALQRLRDREKPPSVFDLPSISASTRNGSGIQATVNAVRGAVRLASTSSDWKPENRTVIDSDSENEDGPELRFSTEPTFQLLTRVRDTLIIHGDQIFLPVDPGLVVPTDQQNPLKRSLGSKSKTEDKSTTATNENLLDDLLSILAEIVTEDCRFKVNRIRLTCPPHALQGVVLEVASMLAKLHRTKPEILSRLGYAMLPAFSIFSPYLHARLMRFFEHGLIRVMLTQFAHLRGTRKNNLTTEDQPRPAGSTVPEIQVERAVEDSAPEIDLPFQPWVTEDDKRSGAAAWTAPGQDRDGQHLASLVSPLLACMFTMIRKHRADLETLHQFYSTLSTIVRLKEDAYADIVDVVAFDSLSSRRIAIEALTTFWPKSFGHLILARPFTIMSYDENVRNVAIPPLASPFASKDIHEFILWRFNSPPAASSDSHLRPSNRLTANCAVCTKPIIGIGLYCPCCTLTVHTGKCYDHEGGIDLLRYEARENQQEKISTIRYSRPLPERFDVEQANPRRERHLFEPVHLFSLVLCFLCKKPLWGCYNQGLRCSSCLHYAHASCLENIKDLPSCRSTRFSWKHVTIQWDVLRKSWIEFYGPLMWKEGELFDRSYEEVSIAYGIFWIEMEILTAGMSSGSIVVEYRASRNPVSVSNPHGLENFELHYFVALYYAQLTGSRLAKSRNTAEYIENCGPLEPDISLLHNLPLLMLAASVVKLPQTKRSVQNEFLHVGIEEEPDISEDLPHPLEIVSLAHIRDALGYQVAIFSDMAARFLMAQMHRVGVFVRVDSSADVFPLGDFNAMDVLCSFPSTLAIDASTSVEALFTSIQACLEDLDVSVNEFGFLLLVRRCWPSGLMTDYALSRLTSLVLSWILSEDDRLLLIVRDYISVREPMPGVRFRMPEQRIPWPDLGILGAGSSGIGTADYTATRKAIVNRYAIPWLLKIHDQNKSLYANCLYQQCLQLADASSISSLEHKEHGSGEQCAHEVEMADETLKYIVKLCQWGIVWTTFDDLFMNWLDTMSKLSRFSTPVAFKNLPRLFSSEDSRRSIADDNANVDIARYMVDPWRVIVDAASEDTAGLERCLQWVLILARSGVDIPDTTLMQLAAFARDFGASFITHALLVEVLLFSVWLKSYGRSQLLSLISSIYLRQSDWIKKGLGQKNGLEVIHGFLRHTLAACLLLYGCKRETVRALNLLDPSQLNDPPTRRRSNVPNILTSTDPLTIDMDMLDTLSFAATEGTAETCLIIAKFLSNLVTESSLLTEDQVDQFVVINGHTLCKCAWHFYAQTQIPELNSLRAGFLLRLLIVDTKPFENLLIENLSADVSWEHRFDAITRIFRIILDVNTPGLDIVGRQWRSSVVPIFLHFFAQSWKDDRVEVRLACETLAKTLLPMHMDTMSLCFEQYLLGATVAEKISLAMSLTLLHPMLPSWCLISWPALVQALGLEEEEETNQPRINLEADSVPKPQHDPELTTLRATLVNLALQMIADGIVADLYSLLRVKLCLVRLIGFQKCRETPSRNSIRILFERLGPLSSSPVVQSCFQGLMRALDTSLLCDLPPACMIENGDETMIQACLGSIFVDIVIKTVQQIDFAMTPYLVIRSLLTSLVILFSKHDFSSPLLNQWTQPLYQAVHTVMQLLPRPDLSFDIKQTIFAVGQAAVKQLHFDRKTSTLILSEYISVTTTLISEHGVTSDHMLSFRGRQFFEEILTQFASQRIYWTLFKAQCTPDFFITLAQVMRDRIKSSSEVNESQPGENLCDSVVREILYNIRDKKPDEINVPLKNLAAYVDVVHHTGYPDSLIGYLGNTISVMAEQMLYWKSNEFDANPLLRICTLVAQHHKLQGKELLVQGEKYLRSALVHFQVDRDSIAQLLQVSVTSHRRPSKAPGTQVYPNYIPNSLIEILETILRGRTGRKAQANTVANILDGSTQTLNIICESLAMKDETFPTDSVGSCATGAAMFVQTHIPDGLYTDADFGAFIATAKLMVQASNIDPEALPIITGQEAGVPIRLWNFLLLAVLTMDWSDCALILWRSLSRFCQTYNRTLQGLLSSPQNMLSDVASIEINQACIALRLWLLLIQQICNKSALSTVVGHAMDRDHCERILWNELWPSFDRLLYFSLDVASLENSQTTVTSIWHSFADIVVLLREIRSTIALEPSLSLYLVQMKELRGGEGGYNKVSRALKALTNPPIEATWTTHLEFVRKNFLGVERIGMEVRKRIEERGREEREPRRQVRQPTATN